LPERVLDLRPDQLQIVQHILQRRVPTFDVWAFGSRVKGAAKPYSDLDLAVITHEPLALNVFALLSDDFSESDLSFKVDVVDWASTRETFRAIIAQDKIVVQVGATKSG